MTDNVIDFIPLPSGIIGCTTPAGTFIVKDVVSVEPGLLGSLDSMAIVRSPPGAPTNNPRLIPVGVYGNVIFASSLTVIALPTLRPCRSVIVVLPVVAGGNTVNEGVGGNSFKLVVTNVTS